MTLPRCPRCNGSVLTIRNETSCLMCAWSPESLSPEREAALRHEARYTRIGARLPIYQGER